MEAKGKNSKSFFGFIKGNFVSIFSILIFIFLFLYFSLHGSGPLGSDELLYADAGLRGYGNYIVMNRYTHIYLQLLFMSLASTPMIGINIFWGFIMSTTAVSVFLFGRYFSKDTNFLHGFFALLIFLSANLFFRYFGVPIVDLTTLMLFMIYLLVMLYFRRKSQSWWIVVLLGVLFFFTFKSKEFAIILLFTLPILGYENDRKFNFRKLVSRLKFYLLGIGIGALVLVGVNAIVLRDPFFGLRFSDWVQFRKTIASFTSINPDPDSYLKTLMLSVYILPFTLYLLSLFKKRDSILLIDIFIWFLPLIYIIMMTLTMIRSGWRTDERYIYPILGLVCALAPQFFEFPLPKNRKGWYRYSIYFLSVVIGFILIRQMMYWFTDYIQMSFSSFVLNYALDIFFIILLMGMIIIKEDKIIKSMAFVLLLFMNLYFPLSINVKTSLRGDLAQKVSDRFAPLAAFKDQITLCETTKFEFSPQVLDDMRIGPDPYEAAGMFNIKYDSRLSIEAFDFFEKEVPIIISIDESDADYILMSISDWQKLIRNNPEFQLERYSMVREPSNEYILLEAVERTGCPE